MDTKEMMAERLKQYQLLIAFMTKQKQAEKSGRDAGTGIPAI